MADGVQPNTTVRGGEEEYILPLGDLLQVIRRRLWVIILIAIVFAAAAVGFSLAQSPTYEASMQILVGQESGFAQDPFVAQSLQQMTQTMTQALNSNRVAERVIEQEDLGMTPEAFLKRLNVQQVPDTQLIQVAYRDANPQRAQRVANAVGTIFSDEIAEVSNGENAITATVWERAVVPKDPVSPKPMRNGLLALVLGLMVGVGVAFLMEHLDDSWRSPEEAERISGVPTIGVIPEFKSPKSKQGRY